MFIDRALVEAALPGYQVEGDLGKGGYGLVLAGQHKLIGRKVAIKILLDTSDDADLRERFLAEARVLAELDHPHIVRIHDYVEHQGTCLLVMELLPGGTLKARMAAGPISPETACALGLAAASALANAHSRGVLHRDVKPDNMMFAADDLLKVTDFGIAKIFDGSETTASGILGTPRYMAPEQIVGSRLFPSTDLYALAGVLYEIFAGRPLFGRPMAVQPLTHHHLNIPPDRLTSVPEPVASVIMRSLAKDPAVRHGDASDFALDLARSATRAFGTSWLQRAEIKVRLDDEVREAAHGTSTTPNPPGAIPTPGRRPGPGMPGAPGRPSGPGTPGGPGPGAYRGPVQPGGGAGMPGPAGPGYGGPYPARPHQPVAGSAGPAPAGWPGYAQRPVSPRPGGAIPPPYRAGQPGMPQGGPYAPGGQPWGGAARQPAPQGAGRRSARTWWIVGGVAFALVVTLALAIVLAAAGNRASDGPPRPSRADIPGTGYVGSPVVVDMASSYSAVLDSAGTLYVADQGNNQIRTLTADGTPGIFAGTGVPGFSGDGGPATAARINNPGDAVIGRDRTIYLADAGNHRLRKVSPAGVITAVAGTGEEGFSGDGGLATGAQLASAERIAVDLGGNVFVADYGNHRIRKIDTDGIITTVAGTGTEGYSEGGGPATQSEISYPNDVAVTDDGTVYFANLGSDTIQKIGPDGILTTVAGTGTQGFSGDGGPATSAQLANPAVDIARDGTIYVADYFNHRIRKIGLSGLITTVAGNGTEPAEDASPTGEGGPALDAQIGNPTGVAVDATGALYISDSGSVRVTRVGTDGIITTVLRAS